MNIERSLSIIKPDAIDKNIMEEFINRFKNAEKEIAFFFNEDEIFSRE